LDTAVNLVDSGKMQSQLNKLEDLAAHYKNQFTRIENYIDKYQPVTI